MWGANVALGVVFPLHLVLLPSRKRRKSRKLFGTGRGLSFKELSWTGTLQVQQ